MLIPHSLSLGLDRNATFGLGYIHQVACQEKLTNVESRMGGTKRVVPTADVPARICGMGWNLLPWPRAGKGLVEGSSEHSIGGGVYSPLQWEGSDGSLWLAE